MNKRGRVSVCLIAISTLMLSTFVLAESSGNYKTIEQTYREIGQNGFPGFAGLIEEEGGFNVYVAQSKMGPLTSQSESFKQQSLKLAGQILRGRGLDILVPESKPVRIVPVDFSYVQLSDWSAKIVRTIGGRYAIGIGTDFRNNRLDLSIRSDSLTVSRVEEILHELEVPKSAVQFAIFPINDTKSETRLSAQAVANCNALTDSCRPVLPGTEIFNTTNSETCTVAMFARRNSDAAIGMLTALHCTTRQNFNTTNKEYFNQPRAGTSIGNVQNRAPVNGCAGTPGNTATYCGTSDSAFLVLSTTNYVIGNYATTPTGALSPVSYNSYYGSVYQPAIGGNVFYVGRTSGKNYGVVKFYDYVRTFGWTDSSGTTIEFRGMHCAKNTTAGPGDSGAPVWAVVNNVVQPVGVLNSGGIKDSTNDPIMCWGPGRQIENDLNVTIIW
ncbi:hypothetical protein [Deinococcus koreensis]|uniref:hypothetical protein n=1 Tax=Deinococcus koreensis TaxID=2054903 RepID=UPI001056E250|nr:hypothetical protein [Deinococcus koreensis]